MEILRKPEKDSGFRVDIMDIDGDRRSELLINICNAYGSSGDAFWVYDCDARKKEARREFFSPFASLRFIEVWKDSGMERYVKVSASHNHGRSDMDDFWPYTVYQYDAKADQYEFVGEIDAWQKEHCPEGFPTEARGLLPRKTGRKGVPKRASGRNEVVEEQRQYVKNHSIEKLEAAVLPIYGVGGSV